MPGHPKMNDYCSSRLHTKVKPCGTPRWRRLRFLFIQYWPSSSTNNPPFLVCGASGSNPTEIYYVATQFPTPMQTYFAAQTGGAVNYCKAAQANCSQIASQETQTTEETVGTAAWQPALPLTIIGTGFGTWLNASGVTQLPIAVAGSSSPFPYLDISNGTWNTNSNTDCQVYIANWTDNAISVIAPLQTNVQNGYEVYLSATPSIYQSPLEDINWLTFAAAFGTSQCPVATGGNLTVKVTNPQTADYDTAMVVVSP